MTPRSQNFRRYENIAVKIEVIFEFGGPDGSNCLQTWRSKNLVTLSLSVVLNFPIHEINSQSRDAVPLYYLYRTVWHIPY